MWANPMGLQTGQSTVAIPPDKFWREFTFPTLSTSHAPYNFYKNANEILDYKIRKHPN